MNIVELRHFFAWCTLINWAILVFWFLLYTLTYKWHIGLIQRMFKVTPEQYDAITFNGIMYYKIAVFLLCLVPYLALKIMFWGAVR